MKTTEKLKLQNAEIIMEDKFGSIGSVSREIFHEKAMAWYFGEILKSKRIELNLTQQELADKAGTKRSYISRIEKGETDMQLSSFLRIIKALGLNFTLT